MLLVLAVVALATAGVSMALPDGAQTRLENETQRLVALLEQARAQSRASGTPVRWQASARGYTLLGLPDRSGKDTQYPWLNDDVVVADAAPLVLGPDAIVPHQAVRISLRSAPERVLTVGTDGLRPFTVSVAPTTPGIR